MLMYLHRRNGHVQNNQSRMADDLIWKIDCTTKTRSTTAQTRQSMTCWTSTKEETVEQQQKWWHDSMSALASQLSKGVLNEMKTRILTSNIKKEKLKLTSDSSQSMKSFFEREHKRYETRKQNTKKKQDNIDLYRQMIHELVQANLSLAANKIKNINRKDHESK
jgi:hypothetical protein